MFGRPLSLPLSATLSGDLRRPTTHVPNYSLIPRIISTVKSLNIFRLQSKYYEYICTSNEPPPDLLECQTIRFLVRQMFGRPLSLPLSATVSRDICTSKWLSTWIAKVQDHSVWQKWNGKPGSSRHKTLYLLQFFQWLTSRLFCNYVTWITSLQNDTYISTAIVTRAIEPGSITHYVYNTSHE